jgi:hypothetical protein
MNFCMKTDYKHSYSAQFINITNMASVQNFVINIESALKTLFLRTK